MQEEIQKTDTKKTIFNWGDYCEHTDDYRFLFTNPARVIAQLPKSDRRMINVWLVILTLSYPACIALVFLKWWLIFSVFIIPPMFHRGVQDSIVAIAMEHCKNDMNFFFFCSINGFLIKKETK